ncbi:HEPN domain-containing protein [Mesorhizobium sp. ASY16-5R]|uniref:HEPN domain-containing protein n=1 Tax=Mesorhizobium sp. ASY16-5R TaxID=3445772 RepID=UPI003FA067C0
MTGEDHRRRRIFSFMTLAREELNAAAVLPKVNERQAAYFQQQAVEKLLRAVLEAEDVLTGPTHNIGDLAGRLPDGHLLEAKFVRFDGLSVAATRYRYPGGSGRLASPTAGEVARLQADIQALAEEVGVFLNGKGYEA